MRSSPLEPPHAQQQSPPGHKTVIIINFCTSPATSDTSMMFLARFPHFMISTWLFGSWPILGLWNFSYRICPHYHFLQILQNWVFSFSTTSQELPHSSCHLGEFSQVFQNLFSPTSSSYTTILLIFPGLPSYKVVYLQDSPSANLSSRPMPTTYFGGSS